VKLNNHHHPLPKLRMSGATQLFHLRVFTVGCRKNCTVKSVNFVPSKPQDIWGTGGRAAFILNSALDEGHYSPKYFVCISQQIQVMGNDGQ
jgi:hypothetical protein